MRTHGTLTRWNAKRGFGFITPARPGDDVFVHVSAFGRSAPPPCIGELICLETDAGPDGRPRAVRVMRAGSRQIGLGKVLLLMAVMGCGALAYQQRDRLSDAVADAVAPAPEPATAPTRPTPTTAEASTQFSCAGRTHCSQMTSCADARCVLQHCPTTQMDGDGDGVPCETQWCR
ncbi:excalibur calcium-binding domain-containing protein [Xanthomonas cassavae CFBP 4642]|uniref:Excalibur calcium-binding domain-containing protein n=1 Tax=Xanthomonas cassavae CFBP 4642 TaxID=1219375 RepID=A0ABS8H9W5_9XANT|nr:excalibur calcium-binding domain-containing protein [Xanthomonas cassavae]MCC4618958.1 excalibur calcium-binding domain-containing protein [Xanthomonas cassavae CFBP 4642]